MLSRTHRFHGLGSLNYAYKQGRTERGSATALKHAPNNRRQTYRVAVVVSKKVAKSAVLRNRIRRTMFEAVRLNDIPVSNNHDLIFSVYDTKITELSATELQRQVRIHLQRAGIL